MEKMKGVKPQKNTPELVSGNKDVVDEARAMRKRGGKVGKEMGKMAGMKGHGRADRKARKSGGICSADWTAAQGEGSKPRG